jgi:hypothetical protein
MTPLVRADLIPRATALDPDVARWSRTDSVDDALGVLDLTFALSNNAGGLPAECQRFDELSQRVRELGFDGHQLCAMTLGQPRPTIALDTSDPSDAAIATRIRIVHSHRPYSELEHADLEALFRQETTARGRSLLAATWSCVLGSRQRDAALAWAIRAVQADPKNPEGGTCNPWEHLVTLQRDATTGDAAVRAMQAWLPWNSYAWAPLGGTPRGGAQEVRRRLRRARVLSPLDANLADLSVENLLALGDRAEARGVAADLARGGLLLHAVASELMYVRIDASEAQFGEALERARRASAISERDVGWVRVQRFELAWRALELAVVLGRSRAVADELVRRFLDPVQTVLETDFTHLPEHITAICTRSSAPERCLPRVRMLLKHLDGASTGDTDRFLDGAERYARSDFIGAARAWRPLLGDNSSLVLALPDAMVATFLNTGAADLAEQVDRAVMERAPELNGATLGHVRAALRAEARNDRKTARRFAELVRDAWSRADELPPALADVRELLARLDGH